jgi:DUF4097 and DUF4098 domain-containing protein YvlB
MMVLRRFGVCVLGAGLVLSTAACEQCKISSKDGNDTKEETGFCSVNRFQSSSARQASATLGDGKNLTIESINGNVAVAAGSGTDVSATFKAFVYRAYNTEESEIQKDFDLLVTTASADADGNVTVSTSRKSGAKNTLGADFDVQVPPGLSGAFVVNQNNGAVDVSSVGAASSVSVKSDNGSVDVNAGSNAASVNVSSANGDVKVVIGAVPAGATGGTIGAEFGDISLTLPTSGGFSVEATAKESVSFGTAPTGCEVAEAASNSKTLTCNGGGAQFKANATGSGSKLSVTYR